MKKTMYVLLAVLCTGSILRVNAQQTIKEATNTTPLLAENAQPQDTVIIKQHETTVTVETTEDGKVTQISYHKKRRKSYQNFYFGMGIDFGLNSYGKKNVFTGESGNNDFLVLNTSKSTNFTMYPVMGEMRITKWFSLTGGLGVEWANYFFEEGWTVENINGFTERSGKYNAWGLDNTLSKSKLLVVYMNVPLMVQFHVPNRHSNSFWGSHRGFFVQAGAIGSVKIGSHTKVKFMDGGNKEKEHSSFNLNLLRYELTGRIGYGWLGAYVNYQMTPMFEKNHGPELYPFSAGISLQFDFE